MSVQQTEREGKFVHVTLLAYTPNPEQVVATAARVCYSDKPISKIYADAFKDKEIIRKCRDRGHLSVFEHAVFTFAIEDVSRALLAQLTRHRIASFSVRSQRYVDERDFDYVMPKTVWQTPEAAEIYEAIMEEIRDSYESLAALGIPKEDARMVLPNACATQLVMTMNARELLHFFKLRCCRRAQREIRTLANEMLVLCRYAAPVLFEKAGALCEVDGKCQEAKPCTVVVSENAHVYRRQ